MSQERTFVLRSASTVVGGALAHNAPRAGMKWQTHPGPLHMKVKYVKTKVHISVVSLSAGSNMTIRATINRLPLPSSTSPKLPHPCTARLQRADTRASFKYPTSPDLTSSLVDRFQVSLADQADSEALARLLAPYFVLSPPLSDAAAPASGSRPASDPAPTLESQGASDQSTATAAKKANLQSESQKTKKGVKRKASANDSKSQATGKSARKVVKRKATVPTIIPSSLPPPPDPLRPINQNGLSASEDPPSSALNPREPVPPLARTRPNTSNTESADLPAHSSATPWDSIGSGTPRVQQSSTGGGGKEDDSQAQAQRNKAMMDAMKTDLLKGFPQRGAVSSQESSSPNTGSEVHTHSAAGAGPGAGREVASVPNRPDFEESQSPPSIPFAASTTCGAQPPLQADGKSGGPEASQWQVGMPAFDTVRPSRSPLFQLDKDDAPQANIDLLHPSPLINTDIPITPVDLFPASSIPDLPDLLTIDFLLPSLSHEDDLTNRALEARYRPLMTSAEEEMERMRLMEDEAEFEQGCVPTSESEVSQDLALRRSTCTVDGQDDQPFDKSEGWMGWMMLPDDVLFEHIQRQAVPLDFLQACYRVISVYQYANRPRPQDLESSPTSHRERSLSSHNTSHQLEWRQDSTQHHDFARYQTTLEAEELSYSFVRSFQDLGQSGAAQMEVQSERSASMANREGGHAAWGTSKHAQHRHEQDSRSSMIEYGSSTVPVHRSFSPLQSRYNHPDDWSFNSPNITHQVTQQMASPPPTIPIATLIHGTVYSPSHSPAFFGESTHQPPMPISDSSTSTEQTDVNSFKYDSSSPTQVLANRVPWLGWYPWAPTMSQQGHDDKMREQGYQQDSHQETPPQPMLQGAQPQQERQQQQMDQLGGFAQWHHQQHQPQRRVYHDNYDVIDDIDD